TMKVTVNAVPNKAPKANAGQNQTITLPTNTVTLSGSGTDEDGTITGYQWSKVSGPVSYSITSPSSATTEVTGLVEGTYKFRLKVTDNKGATGTADVTITVKAGSNQKPIANAGGNKTIVYPENSVILTGSGSDVDGIIASFNWRQLSGPSNANILSINKAQTEVSDLVVGNYEFELTVTNDKGATGRDTMLLMVASAREMTYEKEINIYPNPTKGLSILEIMGVKITERLVVLVSDGTGKVLERREVYSGGAYSHKEQIDFTKYRNGMYFITVISEGRVRAVKRVLRL
ncbi:MAG: T9SS type A sorting domain-containing protein, partial [Chitinophagaceae bacterium]|nr:T9SS type A sorting domain-containing protein [Chitinophagaceae bacterium]